MHLYAHDLEYPLERRRPLAAGRSDYQDTLHAVKSEEQK